METIEKMFVRNVYNFISCNVDKIKPFSIFDKVVVWKDYGYHSKNDFLDKVKSNIQDSIWVFMELMTWGMDKDYVENLYLCEDTFEDREVYKMIDETGESRFFYIEDCKIVELKSSIKLVEVRVFEKI